MKHLNEDCLIQNMCYCYHTTDQAKTDEKTVNNNNGDGVFMSRDSRQAFYTLHNTRHGALTASLSTAD